MYELKIHKNLNVEKWSTFPTEQQIFMIANEVQRLLTCIENGMSLTTQQERIECALELTDLTVDVHNGNFRYELLRWREVFGELYLYEKEEQLINSKDLIKLYLRTLLQLNGITAQIIDS